MGFKPLPMTAAGFIALFGKRTLGIGYALAAAELTIGPVTTSNTARGGAIIHPIMRGNGYSMRRASFVGRTNVEAYGIGLNFGQTLAQPEKVG